MNFQRAEHPRRAATSNAMPVRGACRLPWPLCRAAQRRVTCDSARWGRTVPDKAAECRDLEDSDSTLSAQRFARWTGGTFRQNRECAVRLIFAVEFYFGVAQHGGGIDTRPAAPATVMTTRWLTNKICTRPGSFTTVPMRSVEVSPFASPDRGYREANSACRLRVRLVDHPRPNLRNSISLSKARHPLWEACTRSRRRWYKYQSRQRRAVIGSTMPPGMRCCHFLSP